MWQKSSRIVDISSPELELKDGRPREQKLPRKSSLSNLYGWMEDGSRGKQSPQLRRASVAYASTLDCGDGGCGEQKQLQRSSSIGGTVRAWTDSENSEQSKMQKSASNSCLLRGFLLTKQISAVEHALKDDKRHGACEQTLTKQLAKLEKKFAEEERKWEAQFSRSRGWRRFV